MTEADRLLVSVLKHSDEKLFAKINREWLDSKELKGYKYISTYYRENGELPGVRTFCDSFGFDRSAVDSRPTAYLRKVRERYVSTELAENVPSLIRRIEKEPEEVVRMLNILSGRLMLDDTTLKETKYDEDTDIRLARYNNRVETGGVTYLSMGHPILDKILHGYNDTDLVTFAARAGAKKTFALLYLALLVEAVLPDGFNDILIVTNEMSADQIKERMDCIRYQLPFPDYVSGTLSRLKRREYKEGLEALKKSGSRITIIERCKTSEELEAKIAIYEPSIVFLDGSYLMNMHLGEGWEKITTTTRELKQTCLSHHVPIINTTQLGRGKGKNSKGTSFDAQDEFAFGMSFVQDSDLAIRFYQDKQMIYQQEVGWQIAKGRNVYTESELVFMGNLFDMKFGFELRESEIEEEIPFA